MLNPTAHVKLPLMEADFPQSAREAEEHIRQIRRDKGLSDGPEQIGNNASDLESALKLCVWPPY